LHVKLSVGGGEATVKTAESEPLPPGPVQVRIYVSVAGPVSGPTTPEPDGKGFAPDQLPDAVHEVMMPVVVHESVAVPLLGILDGVTVRFTVGADGGVTVMGHPSLPLPPGPLQETVYVRFEVRFPVD
jgi:hypothetical protein